MLAIVLLPAAFTNTFGRMVGQARQGWLLYRVMVLLFGSGLIFVHHFEQPGIPHIGSMVLRESGAPSGGKMEGKEVRFGIGGSTLTAVVTSNTATGSNNSIDDSYTSLGGMVVLVNMLLGELVFGGLGTGLYSMVMAATITVFLAGLMVGRGTGWVDDQRRPAWFYRDFVRLYFLLCQQRPKLCQSECELSVLQPQYGISDDGR
jgi:K+-transporting ATPase ATPase A chain